MPVPDPPKISIESAFETVETELENNEDRDLREDRAFMEALKFLETRLWKPYPAERLRRALDLAPPARYEAASVALEDLRRSAWFLDKKPRRSRPGIIVACDGKGPPRRSGFD